MCAHVRDCQVYLIPRRLSSTGNERRAVSSFLWANWSEERDLLETMKENGEKGWKSDHGAVLRTIISVDPRPDGVEDVLNVCPQQAVLFHGRHLRLAWIHSLADASQGWSGCEGLARIRVDTALRPQDPAVLIMPRLAEAMKDPIVDLRAYAVPPHYLMPWATIELVLLGEEVRGMEFALETTQSSHSEGRGPTSVLRPAAILDLLRGSAVRSGGAVHIMASPSDPACRKELLLCRRAPEFLLRDSGSPRDNEHGVGVRSHTARDNKSGRNEQRLSGSRQFWAGKRRGCRGRGDKEKEEGGGSGARGYDEEVNTSGVGTTRLQGQGQRHRPRLSPEKGDDACLRDGGGGSSSNAGGSVIGKNGHEGEDCSRDVWLGGEESCYVRRLRDWGVVTACSGVVVPHEALDVRYYDLLSALEEETPGGPAWVETVLRSHPSSVVDDLCESLELTPPQTAAIVSDDKPIRSSKSGGVGGGGGGGALMVHGPPGVGKTCLVEAVALRLRCRLVKVSPGRLAAAAGVQADRILDEAFRYSRMCVSGRVLLLLDSFDRLTPAAVGGVGATRGDVDVGVLNTFVLAMEKGRRDPSWRGRVAVVGVTSWPEHVHSTARRSADREVLIPLPSQPLRSRILRNALKDNLEEWEIEDPEGSETQEAFEEVVGLCQGFTAGDMCAVAATAMSYLREGRSRSRGEALREAFRQVRFRASLGRGGASGGGLASVSGVPNVRWSEVGGLERAKRAVREMVVWPSRYPEAFRRMGIAPASGVLLFGPPGTGKTLLAKAAATETGATFIELKVSDVVRGEVGESEKVIDRAFRTAREMAPSIIFIDEFQALFASRDVEGGTSSRLASQLLVCMDELGRWREARTLEPSDAAREKGGSGKCASPRRDPNDHRSFDASGKVKDELVSSLLAGLSGEEEVGSLRGVARTWEANVMVLAATNAPDAVDAAFLRPGRFDELVYAGLPDDEGRRQILRAAKARMEGAVKPIPTAAPQASPPMKEHSAMKKSGCMYPSANEASILSVPPVGEALGTSFATCTEDSVSMSPRSLLLETPTQEGGENVAKWATDVDEAWLLRKTQGYSGADLTSLVRNATMAALRDHEVNGGGTEWGHCVSVDRGALSNMGRGLLVLARRHFETALATTQPSSGVETVASHESWARQWHAV